MPKAIIIGAGIAGIACAIRLSVKGYDVEVFESSRYPGGKLSEVVIGDYRFDAGPSLFTMPQYVDELYLLAEKDPRNYFNYSKLDTVCNYFYEDGTRIHAFADTEKFAQEIAGKTTDSTETVKKFLNKSATIYDITYRVFLESSLHKWSTYLSGDTLKSVLRVLEIDSLRSMNTANESFFKDPKTIQFFNRYATYNGSDPYQAPATLNIIPHLEHHFGAYFPNDGMYSITTSLVKLAEELGVNFRYNLAVEKIKISEKQVTGIEVNAQFFPADVVISNADIWTTYKKLLSDQYQPSRILNQERSSSALIFYWGIKKTFPELDLHNIFFSENYREEFRYIWKEKSIYRDPTVYINISAKLKPEDAPEGCENWFVMINVPSNSGQNWDVLIADAKKNILKKLSRILGEDVGQLIVCESILDPKGIEKKTSSHQGSIYGTSSNNQFAAFLRQANFSSKIQNLYFTGGSVHPGGGIPLALLSAKIVAGLIKSTS